MNVSLFPHLPDIDLFLPAGDRSTQRVVVAMSGGVDSSVAAALVKYAGYDVVGITLQLYDHGVAVQNKKACCAGQDIYDARRVATALDIPHYVLNYESLFQEQVIENFTQTYLNGYTPVPCIRCNETVKFRDMLKVAKDLGAMALVTGHYIETRKSNKGWHMYRPFDERRDQSYFLFSTTSEQMDFLRFPLSQITKEDIRLYANRLNLVVADKPDSQDICFVPNGDYASVIERLRPEANLPGDIVDIQGNVLGQHQGIMHYTVGQRRGLRIAKGHPLYVIGIDASKRQVMVGSRKDLAIQTIHLQDVNWIGDELKQKDYPLYVRVRSTGHMLKSSLKFRNNNCSEVTLQRPEEGVSPGQACVFYKDNKPRSQILGGGWITKTI